MGNILNGRQNGRIEEVDVNNSNAYCYPSKNGQYFATHFIMGGERFETCQPESYLFGENMDLNFLGSRPTPFPYSAPAPHEPTRTLRALINIRKESLRFIKVANNCINSNTNNSNNCDINCEPLERETESEKCTKSETNGEKKCCNYNIEFTFDTDVKCAITIHYFCSEDITSNGIIYNPKDPNMSSETYYYKRGSNQQFSQSSHFFNPSFFTEEELMYRSIDEKGEFDSSVLLPVVIQCIAQEGDDPRQSHSLIAVVERNHENIHSIKPLKQKLFVDGLCYLLQEIYGIENKNVITTNTDNYVSAEDDLEDNSSECVICMSDIRDTLILPCRHLCLCNGCADSLRYQANNCPICRAPFRALLQLKAVRKAIVPNSTLPTNPPSVTHHHQLMPSNSTTDLFDIPPGYELISLIEALNGPNHQQSHGLFPYRVITGETIETPTNVKKYHKNELRSKKLNPNNSNGSEANSDSASGIASVTTRSRTASSPTTPEVIVSGIPLTPSKEIINESNANNLRDSDIKPSDLWRVPLVTNSKANKPLSDDNGSASSSASSGNAENIALQERVRLLSHDKDDEIDYMNDERDDKLNEEETEMHSFRITGVSPPSLMKDSTGNSSPLSIGISSSSYAIMSLRDGLTEDNLMTNADLMSVATNSSTNNMLNRDDNEDEEDDGSDYFTSYDHKNDSNFHLDIISHNYSPTLLVDHGTDTSLDTPQVLTIN